MGAARKRHRPSLTTPMAFNEHIENGLLFFKDFQPKPPFEHDSEQLWIDMPISIKSLGKINEPSTSPFCPYQIEVGSPEWIVCMPVPDLGQLSDLDGI